MTFKRQIVELMREYGYELIRSANHEVWSNGRYRVVVDKSPSDRRSYLNIRAIVRKYHRETQEDGPERKRGY